MQLFSRNKALAALSLSALAVLGACGDDVTVPAPVNPAVQLTISPMNANMNVGESLNFAVQITGGSTTTPPTLASCTSSNTAVATVAISGAACRVTAVAAGNATVTAAASTGNSAAAAVSVSAPSPAITSLAVSPAAAQLAVGQSVTIVPTVQPAGRTATYAYATSSAAIATVSGTGVVTAVAPGVATVTVTATAAAQGGFAAATIAQAVTITVSDRTPGLTQLNVQPSSVALALGGTQQVTASAQGPRASAATYSYGTSAPAVATVSAAGVITGVTAGTAVITVTAQSTESGAFAASSITALIPVTVAPAAQVVINSLTDNGGVIDITSLAGQFEVNLSVQPNGQNVSSVQAWVCDAGETVAACQTRTNNVPAAQQSFSAGGAQASAVQLYINSAEFTAPNFTTGADANTLYKNGLKTIVATLTTTPAGANTIASNNISQVNFNNQDGWTISWTQPTNRANDAAGNTWYGGPSTPDALIPNATSGDGSFTVVPVIYTPNRTINSVNLNIQGLINAVTGDVCESAGFLASTQASPDLILSTRPFAVRYGSAAATGNYMQCGRTSTAVGNGGAASSLAGYVPVVTSSIDNNNAGGPTSAGITPAAATSIFTPINSGAQGNPTFAGRYRLSLAYRPNTIFIPGDYSAPDMTRLSIRNGATQVDSGWVNGAFQLGQINANTGVSATYASTDVGVGQVGSGDSQKNVQFSFCNTPTTIPSSANTTTQTLCTTPVATGGITQTVAQINLPESNTNFTNSAYYVQAAETDRLGNRRTSRPFTWANTSGTQRNLYPAIAGNPATTLTNQNGVDLTAPTAAVIPNTGAGSIATFPRTDVDSIYSALGFTHGTTNNANVAFTVRVSDSRSGFFNCNPAVAASTDNCPSAANGGVAGPTQVAAGTFSIQRRTAPSILSATNDAVNEAIIRTSNTSGTANNRFLTTMNAVVSSFDPTYREFTIPVVGLANRVSSTVTLTGPTPGVGVDGYYTFTGNIVDRAGNSTPLTQRSVAIDNTNPSQPLVSPTTAVLQGGSTVGFTITGTDGLEVIAGDLSLNYPQLSVATTGGAAVVGQPSALRFRRVTNFSASYLLGFWHNPFAAISDNKLTTPIGAGTTLGATPLNVPVPFIQHIVTVNGNAGPAPAAYFALFNTATDARPNAVQAWTYDIRATMANNAIGNGQSAASPSLLITGGQIPTPTSAATTKDWQSILSWAVYTQSGGTVEYRAQTTTSIVNPPFTNVHIVRQNGATEWEFLGTAQYAGIQDQGGNRFFRYILNSTAINQGAGFTMGAIGNSDNVRAIGVDASGNGLSSANSTASFAIPLPAVITAAGITTPRTNATGTDGPITMTVPNPNAAALTWTCASSDPSVVVNCAGNQLVVSNGTPVAAPLANPVVITLTVTGTAGGFVTNTVTTTFNVTRTP